MIGIAAGVRRGRSSELGGGDRVRHSQGGWRQTDAAGDPARFGSSERGQNCFDILSTYILKIEMSSCC